MGYSYLILDHFPLPNVPLDNKFSLLCVSRKSQPYSCSHIKSTQLTRLLTINQLPTIICARNHLAQSYFPWVSIIYSFKVGWGHFPSREELLLKISWFHDFLLLPFISTWHVLKWCKGLKRRSDLPLKELVMYYNKYSTIKMPIECNDKNS